MPILRPLKLSFAQEVFRFHVRAEDEDDGERQEESDRRGRLDPRRVEAALVVRRVLGHVDRRTAVLTAEGQALGETEEQEDRWREDADRLVRRQEADDDGRDAHDRDRHQERVLASDDVADPAEDDRAKGPDEEARGVGGERRQERRGGVGAREEDRRQERREGRVEIEVVPLDDRPGR